MSSLRHVQKERKRLLEAKKRKTGKQDEWDRIRQKYKRLGPIRLAQDFKFTVKGKPILFSDDQKQFLNDVWKHGVRFALIVAGRGAGKTLMLAVYGIWLIICFDYGCDVSAMGGSAEQSEKIQGYITEWERTIPFITWSIRRNLRGQKPKVITKHYNEISFHTCSETSVRGPHTHKLFQDEVCAGEKAGNIAEIKAAWYEISTSPDIGLIMTSTAHYAFGLFVEIMQNPQDYGFKVYRWAIAEHESGVTDPYQIYKFKTGWKPKLPWFTQEAIDFLRKNSSDEEWLVEALGGIGLRSGLVINPEDLETALTDEIDPELLKHITERRLGIDWGKVSPNAFTVVGRKKEDVYILFNEELIGVRDSEALKRVEQICKEYNIEIILPDPAQYSMNSLLADKGLTIHELFTLHGGQEKQKYVSNTKRHFEHHLIHIPRKYDKLINSIKQLSYDKKGRVRKRNDHSWDSLTYALAEFYEDTQNIYNIPENKRFISLWNEPKPI